MTVDLIRAYILEYFKTIFLALRCAVIHEPPESSGLVFLPAENQRIELLHRKIWHNKSYMTEGMGLLQGRGFNLKLWSETPQNAIFMPLTSKKLGINIFCGLDPLVCINTGVPPALHHL